MVAGVTEADRAGLPDFGPYRILDLLGRGGMGVVHRAYDTVHDRVIALKRLPASATEPEFRARFQRESRIVAKLNHANVIPVNDAGEIDGQLYLDMMLVDGTDLRRALGTGVLDQDQTIAVLTQVAKALEAAHAKGLVHRDVKPSNVLIDRDGHAYLADFGIAREISPEATALTRSGDLVGSWDYMAPERLSGGAVDGRSDQYSLACVLFECLTGRLPHPATDPAAKVAAHLLQPPPAPSVFVPTITQALDEVVLRGMAKDPARRFPSVTAMMTAAVSAAYTGLTVKSAAPTQPGPTKERDQAHLVRAVLRSTAARTPPTRRMPHDYPPTCPYPGLRGFERDDAELFYGRDHVVTDLLVRLAEQLDTAEPVVLVGASGSGKSSVLRAGLLPALAAADGGGGPPWPQAVLTPGPDPVATLAYTVAEQVGAEPAELARTIRETPTEFGALCARVIGARPVRPVIVVDQLEELFTHGISDTDRVSFATALANAHPALVLLAVRADLMERCIELTALLPALTAPVLLGPMDTTELRQAIVAPARDAGIDVEPGLPERLIADLGAHGEVGYDPGALPRLAHALRETWNHSEGNTLTLAGYRSAGGIDGAVARTAEDIYARLDPAGQRALRAVLLRLVTVLDDGGVARRRVDQQEFAALGVHPGIVDHLIAARLVTVDETGARLAHEALLTAWPRLRDWIEEDRAGLVQHRRLADTVRAWTESGGHDDDLYRGIRLATLNSWLESAAGRVRLQPAEQEFLTRSNAAEQAGQLAARRRTRRLRAMVTALSVLLVVAVVAVLVATQQRQDAVAQRSQTAEQRKLNLSRQLAAEAALARGIAPRRVAMSAVAAWQTSPTVEARSALLSSQNDHYRGRLTGHDGPVSGVAVDGAGKIAATGGRDGSLRLWDLPDRRQLAVLDDGDGWYREVSLSSDGRLLLAANLIGKEVTLWSVPDRKKLFTVPDAIDGVLSRDGKTFAAVGDQMTIWDTERLVERTRFQVRVSVRSAFSPDAALVATTDKDKVEVHRVADGVLVSTMSGHTGDVTAVDFDPSGTRLASASFDGTVRLWEVATGKETQSLANTAGSLNSVLFSPQGTSVAAGGVGDSVYAWDPVSGYQQLRLASGSNVKLDLTMTGDGHTLLSADSDGVVTVWAFERVILGTHFSAVLSVAAQPGGALLAVGSSDGTVALFDRRTGDLAGRWAGHTEGVTSVAFSPDGAELATADNSGALIVWDSATAKEKRRFARPGTELKDVEFSPDGTIVAVAGSAGLGDSAHEEILLLRASDLALTDRRPTKDEPRNPQGPEVNYNHPTDVAFSPDGRTLGVSLAGGKLALWNLVDRGTPFTILPGHPVAALNLAFSPDGTLLASAGDDRQVRIWRVRDGAQTAALAHDTVVRAVAFSPDGAVLATASQDPVVRLWNVRTGALTTQLDRHNDDLNDVVFDDAGELVVSGSADGTARIWDLDPDRAVRNSCQVLDQATLAKEWSDIGPDRGDPPRCPN